MAGIVKNTVRVGVIVLLAGGVVAAVAGPAYTRAAFSQARDAIRGAIDQHIDDPVALREQLRSLEAQYPDRIAAVRRDLGELRKETAALQRELEISERVVALADADLGHMTDLFAKAEQAKANHDGFVTVRVVFDNRSLSLDEALAKAAQVRDTRDAYANRADELKRDLGYLTKQEDRLVEILTKLETEQREFQAKLFQLDRQIDAIARNERLIGVMEEREEAIAKHSRFEAASLDQFQSRMADIRAAQEAQLERLAMAQERTSYEEMAKQQLDARGKKDFTPRFKEIEIQPQVLEIGPDTDVGAEAGSDSDDGPKPSGKMARNVR